MQGIVNDAKSARTKPNIINLLYDEFIMLRPKQRRKGATLRSLRTARGLTQLGIATKAEWAQEAVSRLEREGVDPRVSTLRRYVEALGGSLRIVFVDRRGESEDIDI